MNGDPSLIQEALENACPLAHWHVEKNEDTYTLSVQVRIGIEGKVLLGNVQHFSPEFAQALARSWGEDWPRQLVFAMIGGFPKKIAEWRPEEEAS